MFLVIKGPAKLAGKNHFMNSFNSADKGRGGLNIGQG
jgi:hypothetical protein